MRVKSTRNLVKVQFVFDKTIVDLLKSHSTSERMTYSQFVERCVVEKLVSDRILSKATAKSVGYHSLIAKD